MYLRTQKTLKLIGLGDRLPGPEVTGGEMAPRPTNIPLGCPEAPFTTKRHFTCTTFSRRLVLEEPGSTYLEQLKDVCVDFDLHLLTSATVSA